ncbi:tetraacyldisaccharide 4'-kinase [Hydrogenovibrio sp. 3SP14C1]|uniref:tetraacyldisaccharide 4'-kinase n=1 Tax=Hydrogenovibrio sp. 3SP14C1 TaxID=3038774 RepID=UPI002415FA4C|nr:tetraacyldisaccharide 4'-kinase [Hydrogenovibrio sp. 3SP14C1]MDG4812414.1 tetraacyldisaccharide 4'-kinase [Hydrogenovibrio sp. 3SP14C1]
MSWPAFWSQTPTQSWKTALLWPVGKLVCWVAARRLKRFKKNGPAKKTAAQVIVVGNIVVGGSGKTPFIQWLGRRLSEHGLKYGVVSRGYGGQSKVWPQWVTEHSEPTMVGDEPVLLAQSLQCPVAVSPNRPEAIALLESKYDLDVIISDDGLQHYKMARDIEIVMMDSERLLGNGYCLPAGPLRESRKRLGMVDFLVWNGGDASELASDSSTIMKLVPQHFRSVANPKMILPISSFKHEKTQAMAGIGNPQRFFNTLSELGIDADTTSFADHKAFESSDFEAFESTKPLLMTEKDAVKCRAFAQPNWWYLEVQPLCPATFAHQLFHKLGHYDFTI